MKAAMVLSGGTATEQLELAIVAERCGWDGIFVWESAYGVDAWSLLAAMAVRTERVRLGTMLTPLPWRRPWKVASQVATLDQLSGGRAILAVGLGAVTTELPEAGEVTDLRGRADLLDEGIDLVRTLLDGCDRFVGRHYSFDGAARSDVSEMARPVQARIPIWVVGLWPRPKSMRRVLRCDGIVPQYDLGGRDPAPADAALVCAWLAEHGAGGLDVVSEGETPAGDHEAAAALVRPWGEAGCTWWLETRWELPHHSPERIAELRERLEAGPPTVG